MPLTTTTSYTPYVVRNAFSKNRLVGLWRLMSGYQTKFSIAAIALGISALAKTYSYLLISYFIDHYFSAQGSGTVFSLPMIAAGFVLLAAVQGYFSFLSGSLAAKTSERVTQRLRDALYDHIQHLSFSYHDQTDTGDLIQRSTSDVESIRKFYADQAINAGRIILWFIINFIALLTINVSLALISIVVIPILVAVSVFFFKRVMKAYEAVQEQEAVLTTTLQENLSGVRIVKAFARQDYEIDKFDKNNWESFQRGKKLVKMHSTFWPLSDILCGLQTILGYIVGAWMVINGTITIGQFLGYVGMLVWIIFPMRNMGRLIVQMSTGLVSFDRVFKILNENREPLDEGDYIPDAPVRGEISFRDVCFRYPSSSQALDAITFDCKPGQSIALLGSTGSGKTTLVNLLPRFYEYTQGSITLDGIELNRYPRRILRQQIGIVEQEPFLFSRTIRENITYGVSRSVSDEEVYAATKAAAIHDVILNTLGGYDTLVGERGVTLSGGQKQRLAIARTLLKNPSILILDDSTSSVDTETEAEIRYALQNLMQHRTSFIIAHRIQSIMNADLILVLDKGGIIQKGRHDDLVKQDGVYRKIYEYQTLVEQELEKEIANA